MSETSPYGVHQHAAPGAVRLHTLVGEPIDRITGNQVVGSPATFSTAPYLGGPKPPKPKMRAQHKMCAHPLCRGWAKLGSEWCRHHEPHPAP